MNRTTTWMTCCVQLRYPCFIFSHTMKLRVLVKHSKYLSVNIFKINNFPEMATNVWSLWAVYTIGLQAYFISRSNIFYHLFWHFHNTRKETIQRLRQCTDDFFPCSPSYSLNHGGGSNFRVPYVTEKTWSNATTNVYYSIAVHNPCLHSWLQW